MGSNSYALLDMGKTQGPLLLGYLLSYTLYGVFALQVFLYNRNFPKDRVWMKAMVWSVACVETLSVALTGHAAYWGLAAGWGNPDILIGPIWSFVSLPPLGGIVSCVVHAFFCWRIYSLGRATKSQIMPAMAGFIMILSLTQCAFAFYCGIQFGLIGIYEKISSKGDYILGWLGGNTVCDILIALTMVIFFVRSKNGVAATDHKLDQLITFTIETGAITALASVLELSLYLPYKEMTYHFAVCVPLTKLYGNVLLATLNARLLTRSVGTVSTQISSGSHLSTLIRPQRIAPLWSDAQDVEMAPVGVDVKIDKTTISDDTVFFDNVTSGGKQVNEVM